MTDLSKEAQLQRSPGGNRRCPRTGEYKGTCKCRPCMGARNRRKGKRGEKAARQALGLKDERWRGRQANEETWTSALRVEVKTGGNMANPIQLRYDKMRGQSEQSHAIGDPRPFAAVVKADGHNDVIVMIKGADLPSVIGALLEEWAGEGVR